MASYSVIKIFLISVFAGLFVLNLYFRFKVLKAYKYLVKNDIKFSAKHVLSRTRMENEVYPKYAVHKAEIENFVNLMRNSIKISLGVILLLMVCGLIFKYNFSSI